MKNAYGRRGRRTVLASLTGCAAIAPLLPAQDFLLGWGGVRFRTDAYAVAALDLAATGSTSAVLRVDGRILVHGGTRLPDAPPAPAGTRYTRIGVTLASGSGQHGVALASDGSIVSWSASGTGLPAPARPPNSTWVQMAVGVGHVLALRSDGVAVAWGQNWAGQTTVPPLPPNVTVRQVRAAGSWSLLLLSDGTIAAFGSNSFGQTGVPALPAGVVYADAWIGPNHAIARRSDGSIVAWGGNWSGQCDVPVPPAGVTYTTMGLGSFHSVAARSDGAVVAWGENGGGQCDVPALPPGSVDQIVAGDDHSMIRFGDGAVVGWGGNPFAVPPPTPPPGERWIGLAAGSPLLGLTAGGRIASFGDPAPVPAPPGLHYTEVVAGTGHAVALRSDGRAVAWGANGQGQCAIPPLPPGMSYTAGDADFGRTVLLRSDGFAVECGARGVLTVPPPPPGTRYEEVACNRFDTILRRSDGAVVVVGQSASQSVPAPPAGVHYVSVAMARLFCAALRSDGEVVTWGGQPAVPLPPLPAGVVYVQIDAGDDALAARRSDGRVVATDGLVDVPVPAAGESFLAVSAGRTAGAVRVGPTSTYVSFAAGCAGSLPASRLVPRETPRIGRVHEVTVFDLPRDAALMVFGWSRMAPIPLGPIGMPGCSQHVTADAAVLLLGRDGQAKCRVGIPDAPGLVGLVFHNQAVVLDPAANAAGAVVSAAAEGVVGHW